MKESEVGILVIFLGKKAQTYYNYMYNVFLYLFIIAIMTVTKSYLTWLQHLLIYRCM